MPKIPEDGVPKSPHTGIPGWDTDAEEEMLIKLARTVPDGGVIVEIGSEYGRSAGAFLLGSKRTVRLVSVDLFPTDHPLVGDLLAAYQGNVEEIAQSMDRYVGTMRGDSAEASKHWPADKSIDLLFVDAGHTYEQVKADIDGWMQYVRIGGVATFHDCAVDESSHPLHLEVSRAIDDWQANEQGNWTELPRVDTLRAFVRMG